ncbi:hypothetical protein PPROV_000447000 [Pycnococcus provasolii]|uniref:Saposin B-type domain-containing protein n=1 Tax=Pycnococcus provasolii TaxID=41880 RepID=A0A830HIR7_9CHLO|nr:hypothetical protein PPROV_000447000 [Pycnococcus provasolii]
MMMMIPTTRSSLIVLLLCLCGLSLSASASASAATSVSVEGKKTYALKSLNVVDNSGASMQVSKVVSSSLKDIAIPEAGGVGCNFCVQIMDQIIQNLMNYILNIGVLGTCAGLCSNLPKKLEQTACNLLCDAVGIEGFVKAIQAADLDPIYYCQLVKTCEAKDCPSSIPNCVTIDSVSVNPGSAGLDAQFTATAQYTVTEEIGAGEIQFALMPVDGSGEPIGSGDMFPNLEKGTFNAQLQFQPSNINQQCEQQQQPDFFTAGKEYEVVFVICEGQCGSGHPHTKLFGMMRNNFNITNQEGEGKIISVSRKLLKFN